MARKTLPGEKGARPQPGPMHEWGKRVGPTYRSWGRFVTKGERCPYGSEGGKTNREDLGEKRKKAHFDHAFGGSLYMKEKKKKSFTIGKDSPDQQ